MEKIDFVGCNSTWLRHRVEVLMYIQIYILVKEAFFLEGIRQFDLIINQTNKRYMVF